MKLEEYNDLDFIKEINQNYQYELKQYNFQVKQYFSEVMERKEIKKLKPEKAHFLILLGGKNVGKSYWAINKMLNVIKVGGRGCYMRNSLEEIKSMKGKLGALVREITQENIRCTDEGIYSEDKTKCYINFVQAKNYNKLSGNLEGYDICVYDEFNQILKGSGSEVIASDFFNIVNTMFRNKPIKFIACGNTKTKNNLFFNIFKIPPILNESNLTSVMIPEDKILFLQYQQTLFKNKNGDETDYNIYAKYDKKNYNQMFSGTVYEKEDRQVVNAMDFNTLNKFFTRTKKVLISNNTAYSIWKHNQDDNIHLIHKHDENISIDDIEYLGERGYKVIGITFNDFINEHKFVSDWWTEDSEVNWLLSLFKEQKLFFDSYEVYTVLQQEQKREIRLMTSIENL